MNPAIEQVEQSLQGVQANPGMTACQRIGANEHDGTRSRNVERIADADGMNAAGASQGGAAGAAPMGNGSPTNGASPMGSGARP